MILGRPWQVGLRLERAPRRLRSRGLAAGLVGLALAGLAFGLWVSFDNEQPVVAGLPQASSGPVSPGTRLLAGEGELWVVDVASASVRHVEVPELSPGDAPHRLVRRDGTLVAWGYQAFRIADEHVHRIGETRPGGRGDQPVEEDEVGSEPSMPGDVALAGRPRVVPAGSVGRMQAMPLLPCLLEPSFGRKGYEVDVAEVVGLAASERAQEDSADERVSRCCLSKLQEARPLPQALGRSSSRPIGNTRHRLRSSRTAPPQVGTTSGVGGGKAPHDHVVRPGIIDAWRAQSTIGMLRASR